MHESDDHDIFFGGGASGVVQRSDSDEIALTTIGVDVGSSTFHFMFSALYLSKNEHGQFGVFKREILWRSPVYLTPYRGSRIDAAAISLAISLGHQAARIPAEHVESGAIILTGEALRTENARLLAREISEKSGSFVSVSAGHHLEAMLAAFGSGAVGIARSHDYRLLHVDVGGGTTKFAAIEPTGVRQTAAINGGGRTIAFDGERRITRIGSGGRALAGRLGLDLSVGEKLSAHAAEAIATVIADAIAGVVNGRTPAAAELRLRLTPTLDRGWRPEAISFSGGVSEYFYNREQRNFGDIGLDLASALRARLSDGTIELPLVDPGEGIRATVIGAAQSTMQLSLNAVAECADAVLPLHDVPVVHPHLADSSGEPSTIAAAIRAELNIYGVKSSDEVALSFSWDELEEGAVRRLARGIAEGLGPTRTAPAVVLTDNQLAGSLDKILREELGLSGGIVCLDGFHLSALEYLDIGKRMEPSGVVPIIIKSLLFETPEHHHHEHLGPHAQEETDSHGDDSLHRILDP